MAENPKSGGKGTWPEVCLDEEFWKALINGDEKVWNELCQDQQFRDELGNGNKEAWEALYLVTKKKHFRSFGMRLGKEFEDILHETLIRACASIHKFEWRSSIDTYLYRIAHRTICTRFHKRRRELPELDIDTVSESSFADPKSAIEEQIHKKELMRLMKTAVNDLTLREKTLFELYYDEEMTAKQIADLLGVPEGTVSGTLSRIMDKLRKRCYCVD